MKKIRVLLADDEIIIRRGLQTMLEKDPSIEVVGEAEDGELALELCKRTKPEIVFIDINMPFLDGLSCIELLRQMSPSTVVIVISGYDDFEFARKAIELGVFAYLLKPVKEASFFETLAEAKKELLKTQETEQYLLWAKEQLAKNKEALCAYFLHALLSGSYEEEIHQEIKYLEMRIPYDFSLFLVKITQKNLLIDENNWQDSLLFFAARDNALCLFPQGSLCYRNGNSEMVLLSKALPFEERKALIDALQSRLDAQIPSEILAVSTQGEGYLAIGEKFSALEDELAQLKKLPKTMVNAENYLAKNFWQNSISLREVAEHVQVTSQHLSRLF